MINITVDIHHSIINITTTIRHSRINIRSTLSRFRNSIIITILSPADRAHLLNDAVSIFARTKPLNMSVVMDLLNYMEKETDFLPWFSAFQAIGIMNNLKLGDINPEVKVMRQKVATVATKALELIENQMQAKENNKGYTDDKKMSGEAHQEDKFKSGRQFPKYLKTFL
uniref:Uncharacterized protein n=1 Tax=Magallana gigas TaxID=29159 RepID=K1QP77_MAGGI